MDSRKITVIILSVLVLIAIVFAAVIIVSGGNIFGDDGLVTTQGSDGNINVGGYENKFPTAKPDGIDVNYRMDYLSEDLTKYVTLGEYKGLKASAKTYEITDALIESELEEFLEEYVTYEEITNRETAEGDTIVVDYTGTLDGVAFSGGSATNAEILLDKDDNGYIPGFIDGMYGVKPGNTVEYPVTFPDDYGEASLAGKEVMFKVKVEYIQGDAKVPELTDKFVSEKLSEYGCKTVEAFMLYFKGYLNDQRNREMREQLDETLLEMLISSSTVAALPETAVESRYWLIRQTYENYANTYDMDYAEFLEKQIGKTDEDLRGEAESYIKEDLVIYAIVKAEGLQLTDKEYTEGLKYYAEQNKTSTEAFEEYYTKEAIWETLQYEKMMDFIVENADVEEIISSADTSEGE